MRSLLPLAFVALLVAPAPARAGGADVITADSFESLVIAMTPKIELSPGESDTYCYYFRSANRGAVAYADVDAKIEGIVTGASLYGTHNLLGAKVERLPAGSVSTIACGLLVANDEGVTTIATRLADLPLGGVPQLVEDALGQQPITIEPNAPMFLKITMTNANSETRDGRVTLLVED